MERVRVHFDVPKMSKAVQAFVRARAIKHGSFIAYKENGYIVRENPRTGEKTIVKPSQKNR